MLRVSSFQTLAGISLIVIGALTTASAAAPEDSKAAKPAAAAPAAGAGKEPAGITQGTPPPAPGTPDPGVEATVSANKAACKKAVTDLGSASGGSALKSLDDSQRANLMRAPEATQALTCLAVAHDNKTYCDALPDPGKGTCGDSVLLARELKKLPKGQEKAFVIHQLCVAANLDKVECTTARDSIAARNAARCGELKNPSLRDYCTAIASGDPAKCAGLKGDERPQCEAYASDDPTRCPKDSADCQQMTRTFAAVKAEGLAGAKDIDPAVVAIRKGKDACSPLLGELEKASCTEIQGVGQ